MGRKILYVDQRDVDIEPQPRGKNGNANNFSKTTNQYCMSNWNRLSVVGKKNPLSSTLTKRFVTSVSWDRHTKQQEQQSFLQVPTKTKLSEDFICRPRKFQEKNGRGEVEWSYALEIRPTIPKLENHIRSTSWRHCWSDPDCCRWKSNQGRGNLLRWVCGPPMLPESIHYFRQQALPSHFIEQKAWGPLDFEWIFLTHPTNRIFISRIDTFYRQSVSLIIFFLSGKTPKNRPKWTERQLHTQI